jgi:hypothetical protein
MGAVADSPGPGECPDQQEPTSVLVVVVRLAPLRERPTAVLVLDLDTQPVGGYAQPTHNAVTTRVREPVGDELGNHQDGVLAQCAPRAPHAQQLPYGAAGQTHRRRGREQAEHR